MENCDKNLNNSESAIGNQTSSENNNKLKIKDKELNDKEGNVINSNSNDQCVNNQRYVNQELKGTDEIKD
jgi:hypothetical protein